MYLIEQKLATYYHKPKKKFINKCERESVRKNIRKNKRKKVFK